MVSRGFDIGAVMRSPGLIATIGIAFIAWFIAFISQCVVEAQSTFKGVPVLGGLWFAIWVQILVIVFFLITVANGSLHRHRFALAIFTAICVVFAVQGVQGLYPPAHGPKVANGVGWLLLCIVDLVWLLFLTSDEDSWLFYTFSSGAVSGWGASSSSGRRQSGRASRAEAGIYGNESGNESAGLRANGADRGMSSHELPATTYANDRMGGSMGYQTPINLDGPSPVKLNAVSPQQDFASAIGQSTDTVAYKHKARANYAYSASPDDPNEVSFVKGEILEVHDTTGKWYQVRTAGGQTGIAPSNYLTLL
ncbi:hypothetical protein CspeluHIS016_0111590 [Cutaneotrichosporon spelunceum]|uniref:SH3 domain-containing protein n=1 Tax=Cutaneotrichosporon spelunceum TaxID=1672016 RepID=A0AAD3TQ12_9TREE|nr:hypothetical protein CspeluHIS016_0111590 [Cutaneotrichosporon spelunceum]